MMGPFAYSEDSIDRCVLIEIPRLVALSKVMESMTNICRESRACAYDMDKDNVVGLDDVGSLDCRCNFLLRHYLPSVERFLNGH